MGLAVIKVAIGRFFVLLVYPWYLPKKIYKARMCKRYLELE